MLGTRGKKVSPRKAFFAERKGGRLMLEGCRTGADEEGSNLLKRSSGA